MDREAPELRALASHYADRGGALWIADDGVGMVATAPLDQTAPGGSWEICQLYVHPDQHGTALGAKLLQTAERHAIALGATDFVLWTDTRFRRAHRFYEKQSYVRAGALRALHDLGNSIEYRYAKPVDGVRQLDIAAATSAEPRLTALLVDCVGAGASVSFRAPLDPATARAFWSTVTTRVGTGATRLFAAWSDGTLAGTVQLVPVTVEIGRHRAEIAKLLVDPAFRRRGLGGALLSAAEQEAAAASQTLLLLDTKAGDDGEHLYRRHGWQEVGRIEGYTREADGEHATVLFSKRL